MRDSDNHMLLTSSCQKQAVGAAAGFLLRRLRAAMLLMAVLVLAGCSTLPPAGPKPESTALPPPASGNLAAIAQASTPPGELSGFRLLPLGPYALEARLELIRRASSSLDLQYFIFEDDATGRRLLRGLRDAAERGVRVRLLLDDLYTADIDPALRALADHPGIEVRLFNPICCLRGSTTGRILASLGDLYRINHRMHNKLLVADGLFAVAGGRNIADEYFMLDRSSNFVDLDAFIAGAVVSKLQRIFDDYWNSGEARTVQQMVPAGVPPAQAPAEFERLTAVAEPPPALPQVDPLGYGPIGEDLEAGRVGLIWAPARAFADPPDKRAPLSAEQAQEQSVSSELRMKLWSAQEELVLTSPYLVPGALGMTAFEDLGQRRVRMTVITNSLAATDEPLVHTGYARYRPGMLAAGVDLYEISPERTRRNKRLGMFGSSFGRLHAKTAVVDGRNVFIGSKNLDPRSEVLNTELGIFIDSPQLARELLRIVNISKLQSAYRVRLDDHGALQWLSMDDEKEVVLTREPEASLWLRLHNRLIAPFVPEQLL